MDNAEPGTSVLKLWQGLKTKSRYLGFLITILTLFTDMTSRVGISLAMIGGMVKHDCTDPDDQGEFCWSEDFKATVLGAYFYGYTLQIIPTTFAKRIGFNVMMRITILLSAIIQFTFPTVIQFSPTLAIILQAIRGFSAGIIMPNNMEFARKWSIGNEGGKFISFIGVTTQLAMGVGPLLGGLITTWIGWRYYFYINAAAFLLMFCLQVAFVPNNPLDSWVMCTEERRMFAEKIKAAKPNNDNNNASNIMSVKSMLSKIYAWSFCIYMMCQVFQFYTTITNTPFYLNNILKATPTFLSYLQLGCGILASLSTYCFSIILPKMDKKISWLKCRMMFLLLPMIIRLFAFSVFPHVTNLPVAVVLLGLKMVSYATTFSGSIVTVNYEMDPVNAAMILGLFNSFGQMCGFLSPLVMAWMTTIDKKLPDYSVAYHQRWSYFFYVNAGMGLVAVASIIAALAIRPGEWKKHHSLVAEELERKNNKLGAVIIQNPIASSIK